MEVQCQGHQHGGERKPVPERVLRQRLRTAEEFPSIVGRRAQTRMDVLSDVEVERRVGMAGIAGLLDRTEAVQRYSGDEQIGWWSRPAPRPTSEVRPAAAATRSG